MTSSSSARSASASAAAAAATTIASIWSGESPTCLACSAPSETSWASSEPSSWATFRFDALSWNSPLLPSSTTLYRPVAGRKASTFPTEPLSSGFALMPTSATVAPMGGSPCAGLKGPPSAAWLARVASALDLASRASFALALAFAASFGPTAQHASQRLTLTHASHLYGAPAPSVRLPPRQPRAAPSLPLQTHAASASDGLLVGRDRACPARRQASGCHR
mmetsp:Transcript_25215/g.56729  ORF Transcript_25215/g.56729 Transcript_25215/m.56729 type:complete len:221 (+) Transcript_25215:1403-2065(+)